MRAVHPTTGHGLFNAWWVGARDDAGLEGMRFHDLRHGFASALITAGCSVTAVQRALGHASASTTLDVYSHLWPATRTTSVPPSTGRWDRLRTN
jgi:integrase